MPEPSLLPYGHQWVRDEDIQAVRDVLRSDWLTQGPKVEEFEKGLASYCGVRSCVAVSSGTAALHAALHALDIRRGDEVIVPCVTFAATANAVIYQGARPVFCDVAEDALLIDLDDLERKIGPKTKAVIAVDYAGQPCDYAELRALCERHRLALVADACHSLGASYQGRRVGQLADLTIFSFHPVKAITTGEGGAVVTDNPEWAQKIRIFRHHGIEKNLPASSSKAPWFYEIRTLGHNYRITDFQCALGLKQLETLEERIARRRFIANYYQEALKAFEGIRPLALRTGRDHAYHLYVIKIDGPTRMSPENLRDELFAELRARGIGVQVHYIPLHLQPLYRQEFGTAPGMCPKAERAFTQILSLPIFPTMTQREWERVIDTLDQCWDKLKCRNKSGILSPQGGNTS